MYAQENTHMCIMGHYMTVTEVTNKLVSSPLPALHSACTQRMFSKGASVLSCSVTSDSLQTRGL